MVEFIVGCPVYRRDWILPKWFEHVESAFAKTQYTPTYLFALDTRDEYTYSCLAAYTDMLNRHLIVRPLTENINRDEKRDWRPERLEHMVGVRNALLDTVRRYSPTFFWSLDSDILVSEDALTSLLESIGDYDAVGGKVYLSKAGTRCPSYGSLRNNTFRRGNDIPYVRNVTVIMASKLMKPSAYSVDYQWHHSGEDIGWSKAAREVGLRLGFDGRTVSKHVWGEEFLDSYDRRCGF